MENFYLFIKRILDLLVSFIGLIVLFPVILLIALINIFQNRSPVLFRQKRTGKHGEVFIIYKFRTMVNRVHDDDKVLNDNERLTKFGKYLRETSLDEIPTLWNVLKGEMSLVGPRPLLVEYLSRYSDYHMRRHEVKPGITGWAQVNGRNLLSWEEKFNFDVWYVDNCNFILDLKILFKTVIKVIKKEGITVANGSPMPIFDGSKNSINKETINKENNNN